MKIIIYRVLRVLSIIKAKAYGVVPLLVAAVVFIPITVQGAEVLRVAAASSMASPLKELGSAFEEAFGTRVIVSSGSTGILSSQIIHGAPFDVFFAADTEHVADLAEEGHIDPGSIAVYARGRIVLAVNVSSGVRAVRPEDLLLPGIRRVAIANPDHAPYGVAAKEVFKALGLWEAVRPKLVYGENIRQTLRFIQTGNAQAGIVALSVADVPGVDYSPIDPALHNPIDKAAGVVASSGKKSLAESFLDYVTGPEGRPVLVKYGLMPVAGQSGDR